MLYSKMNIDETDWKLFEDTYSMPRTDVVEVRNIFKHRCKIFVQKEDVGIWNYMINNMKKFRDIGCIQFPYYYYTSQLKWSTSVMKRSRYI